MTITRYFDATIEGHQRISRYEADTAEAIDEVLSLERREIQPDDLPADFAEWQRYDIGAYMSPDVVVETLSRHGD